MNKTHLVTHSWNRNVRTSPPSPHTATTSKPQSPQVENYTCDFNFPQSGRDLIYVFGDIEGYDNIFDSTVSTIKAVDHESTSFVFLGDLYDYAKPHKSIQQVSDILDSLKIERQYPFNDDTKEIEVIRAFRKLWKQKQLKCYSKYNIQYLHSKPKQTSIKDSHNLFILGNKEVIFVQELITSERITKKDNIFIVPADYKRKHKKPGQEDIKHTDYNFTVNELNTMYTYITLCHNYAIINKTLFIHCYINYKLFTDNDIDCIIAGHSKGYGRFTDDDFKNKDIYIVDLTGVDDVVNNYIIIGYNKIKHCFNDNFKPVLEKLKFYPTNDPLIKITIHHPLSRHEEESSPHSSSSNDDIKNISTTDSSSD